MKTQKSSSRTGISIPGVLVSFLDTASVAFGCTRTSGLIPNVHWVSGWSVEEDGRTLRCLIAQAFTDGLLESVRDNGQFALTVERIGPHETYQFKGEFLDAQPATEGDRTIVERCRERFARDVISLDGPLQVSEALLRDYILPATLALRFAVREIYVQTPGPGAGRRLVPPAEEP